MHRRRVSAVLTALALAWSCAPAVADAPAPLTQLENWARAFAPTVRLAQAEVAIAEQRSVAAQARQGAQLFGGAGLSNAREAVTDTLSREYQRAQVLMGVRWPLLGSRAVQQRETREADQAISRGRMQRQQMEREAVQSVRRAYVLYLHHTERNRVSQAFLQTRAQTLDQLLRRREAGTLLEADRLDLAGLFDIVQAAQDRQDAARELARNDIARLTGQPQATLQTQAPLWPQACMTAEALAAQGDAYYPVRLAQLDADASQQRIEHARQEGLEASVSLAQSVSRDLGGLAGHNTRVGVDFTVPLEWRAQRDAALAQAQGEIDRTQALLQLRRGEFDAASQQALANYRLRGREEAAHERRLQAALETLRIAQLRLDAFDGDGYTKLLQARYALYQAALQRVDGAERRDLAALEVLALGGDCTLEGTEAAPAPPDPLAATLAALALPAPAGSPAAPAPALPGLGWYIWQGQAMLDAPARLRELPPGSRRLLLSFTAPQLRALAEPAGQARLQAYVAQAHALDLRVELLLGEPTWVLPPERPHLLSLLDALRGLPFDGLHLDLERSQLPAAAQRHWDSHLVDTLRAVRARTPWPIALTTHYRELRQPDFARQVHAAGASELVAMVYVSPPDRAAAIARPLLRGPRELRWSVAQSIERALPAQESSHGAGRGASLQRWSELARMLAPVPGFQGIVVQSWEDYREARP